MQEKELIELYLSKLFIERHFNKLISDNEIFPGNPEQKEPDIFWLDKGIEIGAVLKGKNTHLDIYENNFLEQANFEIKGKVAKNIKINLVMQDDKDVVLHKPKSEFLKYKYLPFLLDAIIVFNYQDDFIVKKTIDMNQKSLMRVYTFPKITDKKKFNGFISEIVEYVNNLNENDFQDFSSRGNYKIHYCPLNDGELIEFVQNPLDDFISNKIIEKLQKDKYKGNHIYQILLLHNYSILANTEFITSDTNFFSYYRDYVFNRIFKLINQNKSFEIYDDIFFMDFSYFIGNMDFKIIDFKNYTIKELNDNILNDRYIRSRIRI